jgi:hypothetical protein
LSADPTCAYEKTQYKQQAFCKGFMGTDTNEIKGHHD